MIRNPTRLRRARLPLVTLAALAALAAPAAAQMPDPRVEITAGYYEPSFDSSVRLDSDQLGLGTTLDLENDLLVEDSASELRVGVSFQVSNRNRIVVDRVEFERTGSATVTREIQFGDTVFAADATLAARTASTHTNVSWRFAFVKSTLSEIAVSAGVSILDLEASLEGEAVAHAGGLMTPSQTIAESGDASGPVPLVGLHGRWWIGQRLRLGADARYFDIQDFDGWSGSLTEVGARLDYFLSRNLAVGLGWLSTDIQADFDDSSYIGAVGYKFSGVQAGLTLAF